MLLLLFLFIGVYTTTESNSNRCFSTIYWLFGNFYFSLLHIVFLGFTFVLAHKLLKNKSIKQGVATIYTPPNEGIFNIMALTCLGLEFAIILNCWYIKLNMLFFWRAIKNHQNSGSTLVSLHSLGNVAGVSITFFFNLILKSMLEQPLVNLRTSNVITWKKLAMVVIEIQLGENGIQITLCDKTPNYLCLLIHRPWEKMDP